MTTSFTSAAPSVRLRAGSILGTSANGIDKFLGIPYGQAIGKFGAFGALAPMMDWTDPRDCTALPDIFPQPESRLASIMGPASDAHRQSDQAFTVNVFRPQHGDRLPVLVFVHGGAFQTGGGGPRWYDGSALARRAHAIVVTINYRLGMWGNLSADGVPANNAVRDVMAALHWVSANIGAFGGDADNVTIAGQSAGATLCRLMTLCPETEGLFRRAILLSCPGRIGASLAHAQSATARVMALANVSDVAALAKRPHDEIVALTAVAAKERAVSGSVEPLFRPFADGALLHAWMDDPEQSAAHAHCHDVMIGFTREETTGFFWQQAETIDADPARVLGWYRAQFGDRALAQYHYNASRRAHATPYTQWLDGLSDQMFAQPAMAFAAGYSQRGTAYLYRFDLQTVQPNLYAPHCLDLPFFFDNPDQWHDAPMLTGLPSDAVSSLAARFSSHIAHYLHHGTPGDDAWSPYTDDAPCVMSIDRS